MFGAFRPVVERGKYCKPLIHCNGVFLHATGLGTRPGPYTHTYMCISYGCIENILSRKITIINNIMKQRRRARARAGRGGGEASRYGRARAAAAGERRGNVASPFPTRSVGNGATLPKLRCRPARDSFDLSNCQVSVGLPIDPSPPAPHTTASLFPGSRGWVVAAAAVCRIQSAAAAAASACGLRVFD